MTQNMSSLHLVLLLPATDSLQHGHVAERYVVRHLDPNSEQLVRLRHTTIVCPLITGGANDALLVTLESNVQTLHEYIGGIIKYNA